MWGSITLVSSMHGFTNSTTKQSKTFAQTNVPLVNTDNRPFKVNTTAHLLKITRNKPSIRSFSILLDLTRTSPPSVLAPAAPTNNAATLKVAIGFIFISQVTLDLRL